MNEENQNQQPQKDSESKAKEGGMQYPSKQKLYALAASHSEEAILKILDLMRTAKNENIVLGAATALLDKAIPDLKAVAVSNEAGAMFLIKMEVPMKEIETIGSSTTPVIKVTMPDHAGTTISGTS